MEDIITLAVSNTAWIAFLYIGEMAVSVIDKVKK